MKKSILLFITVAISLIVVAAVIVTSIDDFFLPGSQIGESGNLETPDRCDNCHGGYDAAVEPAFNWRGSMMSQAARDPLFFACMAIAEQDAPGVGDLCLRCHTPDGWLNGRCEPTDGSALNNNDREGVQCDFCHKMVDPRAINENLYPESDSYTNDTWPQDKSYLEGIISLPGDIGNGMYLADANNAKRGPFSDAVGRHKMFTSPFHTKSEHCGTCHDVSNPVFTRIDEGKAIYSPNSFGEQSETFEVKLMFPIERTFSEWKASGYASGVGVAQKMSCQDCHMSDVTGKGAKMKNAPVRTNLPLHDMTGGNTFVPNLVKQLYPSEVDADALDAGIVRAIATLKSAANIELFENPNNPDEISVKVTNNTGHKLPTGYPEGRRIWINMKFLASNGEPIRESGFYNLETGKLADDAKVYHCEPGVSQTVVDALNESRPTEHKLVAGPSFHMALNDMVYFDNRIPPPGTSNAKLKEYQSPVVDHGGVISTTMYSDGDINCDVTNYVVPTGTEKILARLYYQTASKEFIEFLRDENYSNSLGDEIYALWNANGKSTPVVMNEVEYIVPNTNTPLASFIGDPVAGEEPLIVQFTDISTNGPASWFWNFGDENTSNSQNPKHTYSEHGTYTVSLTVSNTNGSSTETKTDYIVVTEKTSTDKPLFIDNIEFSERLSAKGRKSYVVVYVTVVDENNTLVEGAMVYGNYYSGATMGTVSGTTGSNGVAELTSRATKNANSNWCIEITNIDKSGYSDNSSPVSLCENQTYSVATLKSGSNGDKIINENIFKAYPNPFSDRLYFEINSSEDTYAKLDIYDISGRLIKTIFEKQVKSGVAYKSEYIPNNQNSGTYIYRLILGEKVYNGKVVQNQR